MSRIKSAPRYSILQVPGVSDWHHRVKHFIDSGLPSEDFRRHDDARGIICVDLHVPRDQSYVLGSKLEAKVSELLVAESLRREDAV